MAKKQKEEQDLKKYKTYKGCFNYWILPIKDKDSVKTHRFDRLTKKFVDRLRVQFQNPAKYKFVGEMIVRDKDIWK